MRVCLTVLLILIGLLDFCLSRSDARYIPFYLGYFSKGGFSNGYV